MIFIVGNSRSGTTLLGRMLDRHSQIHSFEELHFFEQMVDAQTILTRPEWSDERRRAVLERLLTSAYDNVFAKHDSARHRAEAQVILDETAGKDMLSAYQTLLQRLTHAAGKMRACEQTPRYLYVAEELLHAFPEAVVICMIRDPRAVLLSQKNKWRRYGVARDRMPLFWAFRAWVNYHPQTMALMWASASRRARRLQGHPRALVIQYEQMLTDPRGALGRLCEVAGLPFEEAMLQVALIGSSMAADKPEQLGVDASRMDAWRRAAGGLTRAELATCERTAASEMAYWGYAPEGAALSVWARGGVMASFVIKSGAALLLNLRRIKNLRETVQRRLG